MIRRSIAVLLLPGLVALAGCGSSSKSPGTTASSTSAPASSASPLANASPEVKAAVKQCKSIIRSQTKLPAKAKEKLEGACAEAAKGNTSVVKKVAREVCEETINNSSIPPSAKEQALASCRKT